MSDTPQNKTDVQEDDILEQIISQGLSKQGALQEEPSAGEAPPVPEQDGKKESPPPEKKNKRSSVYLYLLILFGAAFLMLLLAYFVQQRNSETTISDLRNSMNLSRNELMEEIQALEEEKQALLEEKEELLLQLDETRLLVKTLDWKMDDLTHAYQKYVDCTSILGVLYASEVKLDSGDYEGAAEKLTGIEYNYFISTIDSYDLDVQKGNPLHPEQWMLLRPRFDALVETLTDRGVLEEDWMEEQQP